MPSPSAAPNSCTARSRWSSPRYPVLMFMPTDAAAAGMHALAADLRRKGAARSSHRRRCRPCRYACRRLPPDHPDTDAICLIQSFYALIVRLAATARHRCRSAAPSAEGHAHAMSTPQTHAIAADLRLRRRSAASRQRRRDRRRRPSLRWCRARRCAGGYARCRRCRQGAWLAPGFIDMQVNGGGDVLFNDAPTPEGIRDDRGARIARFGTTVAPADADHRQPPRKCRAAIAAVQSASRRASPACSAFISRGRFFRPKSAGRA